MAPEEAGAPAPSLAIWYWSSSSDTSRLAENSGVRSAMMAAAADRAAL